MRERRYDPILAEWRTFAAVPPADSADPCPYCPTDDRESPTGIPVAGYQLAVVGEEPARSTDDPAAPVRSGDGFTTRRSATGTSEVVLFSDRHDQRLADVGEARVARLIDVWADRYAALGASEETRYVLVVETGVETGGHPRSRIHAYPELPSLIGRELAVAAEHQRDHGGCLFCATAAAELHDGTRLVAQNESFLAFVPFAARYRHELHVYSKRHATSLVDLTDPERLALARLIRVIVGGYRHLGEVGPRYVLSVHQAPTDDGQWLPVSHLHVEFVPLGAPDDVTARTATEIAAGEFVGDLLPEQAAAELRDAQLRTGLSP